MNRLPTTVIGGKILWIFGQVELLMIMALRVSSCLAYVDAKKDMLDSKNEQIGVFGI